MEDQSPRRTLCSCQIVLRDLHFGLETTCLSLSCRIRVLHQRYIGWNVKFTGLWSCGIVIALGQIAQAQYGFRPETLQANTASDNLGPNSVPDRRHSIHNDLLLKLTPRINANKIDWIITSKSKQFFYVRKKRNVDEKRNCNVGVDHKESVQTISSSCTFSLWGVRLSTCPERSKHIFKSNTITLVNIIQFSSADVTIFQILHPSCASLLMRFC